MKRVIASRQTWTDIDGTPYTIVYDAESKTYSVVYGDQPDQAIAEFDRYRDALKFCENSSAQLEADIDYLGQFHKYCERMPQKFYDRDGTICTYNERLLRRFMQSFMNKHPGAALSIGSEVDEEGSLYYYPTLEIEW